MRARIYSTIISVLFLLILGGIFYLQILRWPLYHGLSERNHIRLIPFEGLRGTIYDRNGLPIVDNRLSFDVVIIPQEVENTDRTYGRLANILGTSQGRIESIVKKNYYAPFAPIVIASDVNKDTAFTLEEMKQELPGVLVQSQALRWYVYGERTSHVIGYLSLINREELERLRDYGYSMSDLVGRSGVERIYDGYLRGKAGGMQVEVDATGRLVKVLGNKNPTKGRDITLTLDAKLQAYVADCLTGLKGAAVVMDPDNGDILALASSPMFDSNIFTDPNNNDIAADLVRAGSRPLLNRAINGQYPPGSTFKLVVATAALETKKITPHTTFVCDGVFELGNAEFNCWKEGGHGPQDLEQGIVHSCNVYFYNTGRKAGPDIIADYAQRFGLGKPTGIDLIGESSGLVPSPAWKRSRRNEKWYEGETINYAIGQGYLLVTPLQMAEVVSVFASGGSAPKPHLIKKIGSSEVSVPKPRQVNVSKKTLDMIRSAMRQVVDSAEGTGQRARVEGVSVAAKTGTAQNPQGEPHAWFVGYAPADKPKVVMVVLIEHGGHGGYIAADISKKVIEFIRDNTEILKAK